MESTDSLNIKNLKEKADELWEQKKVQESIMIYEDLIKQDKNFVLYFTLGERLFETKQYAKAREIFEKSLELLDTMY